jgi:hypothetical protein
VAAHAPQARRQVWLRRVNWTESRSACADVTESADGEQAAGNERDAMNSCTCVLLSALCFCFCFCACVLQSVWLPHPSLVWVPATLLAADGEVCSFRLQNGEETTVVIDHTTLERVSEASIKGGLNNLVLLGPSARMRLEQCAALRLLLLPQRMRRPLRLRVTLPSTAADCRARHPSLLRSVGLTCQCLCAPVCVRPLLPAR